MARCQTVRRGFTLVELLVVISIIGLMAALLLPALGAAREAGRRTQCSNNQRQLASALIAFVGTANRFPNAGTYGESPVVVAQGDLANSSIQTAFNGTFGTYAQANSATGLKTDVGPLRSWIVDILPNIDKTELANQWDPTRVYFDAGGRTVNGVLDASDKPTNNKVSSTDISTLICPSVPTTTYNRGNSSYVVNGGFSRWHYRPNLGWAGANGDATMPGAGQGPDWSSDDASKSGVMFLGTETRRATWDNSTEMADIKDSSSQTLLLTENVLAGASAGNKFSDGTLTNWASPHPNFCLFIASDDICQGGCRNAGLRPSGGGSVDGAGWVRANRKGSYEAINDYGNLIAADLKGSFPFPSSHHTGGINVAMCDGSARFIKEQIDGTVWSKLITPAGSKMQAAFAQLPLGDNEIDAK